MWMNKYGIGGGKVLKSEIEKIVESESCFFDEIDRCAKAFDEWTDY